MRNKTGTGNGWPSYPTSLCTQDGTYGFIRLAHVYVEGASILGLTLSVILAVESDLIGCHNVELISDRRAICFKGVGCVCD